MRRLLTAFICLFLCATTKAQIVINELGIAPSAGSLEFIELYNRNSCPIDLSCYTIVFSGTSGSGNPTGWTVKIPSGKSIPGCGYFLIGGIAGAKGISQGTGYPTDGTVTSYPAADLDIGTLQMTANAVYMKQAVNAGTLPNLSGQITLLNSTGAVVASVSYNNGNNPGSYPLSAYTSCSVSGNSQGTDNIADPGSSVNNVNAVFSSIENHGIYLDASGNYIASTSLSPGLPNPSQTGCAPTITTAPSAAAVCFNANSQISSLDYSATTNSPSTYSIIWNTVPANSFTNLFNAPLPLDQIPINIPAGTPAGTYTGIISVSNSIGSSCSKAFTLTVNALPAVSAGVYPPVCTGSSSIMLTGSPAGGAFSGNGVSGTSFIPSSIGDHTIYYTYTDPITNCSNTESAIIAVHPQPVITVSPDNVTICAGKTIMLIASGASAYSWNPSTGLSSATGATVVANPVSTSTYTVTGTDEQGCSNSASVIITVDPFSLTLPTVDVVQPNCTTPTGSIRISAPFGTEYSYSIDGINFQPSGSFTNLLPGTYPVSIRNSSGCTTLPFEVGLVNVTSPEQQFLDTTACGPIVYKDSIYTVSTIIKDTVRSLITGCDSIIRTINMHIGSVSVTGITMCLLPGESFNFNGQLLSSSGQYTASFQSKTGCDSIVHLSLVIAKPEILNLSGCGVVHYNGIAYTTSTSFTETIPSLLNGCDSVLKTVHILVKQKPYLAVPSNKTICAGSSATLTAASDALVEWPGWGTGNSITVSPPSTSIYTAVATSANGCSDTAYATVTVERFNLSLFANRNPVVAGIDVTLQTTGNAPYRVISWLPVNLFSNQTAFSQKLIADTSTIVTVLSKSGNGCLDSASITVVVDPLNTELFIPAAFTPNGDGKNDVFRVLGGKMRTFDLKIFNRWGQLLFSTKNRSTGWDGSFAGKPQLTGTYVYALRSELQNGVVINKRGTLLLIR